MEMDLLKVRKKRKRLQDQEAKQSKRDRSRQRQGRLLGAGFPLLFGGGIGAVGGSLLGSFLAPPGEEFGAQIAGSAAGSKIEELVRRANSLATAAREVSFEKLEEQSLSLIHI